MRIPGEAASVITCIDGFEMTRRGRAGAALTYVMLAAGVLGYVLRRFSFDVAPLLLAFVLSDKIEVNFRRALTISNGDYGVFLQGTTTKLMLCGRGIPVVRPEALQACEQGYARGRIGTFVPLTDLSSQSGPGEGVAAGHGPTDRSPIGMPTRAAGVISLGQLSGNTWRSFP